MGKNNTQESQLFAIANNYYYFDLDEITEFVKIQKNENLDNLLTKIKSKETENGEESEIEESIDYGQIIDISKWETLKVLMEAVLNEHGPIDEAMGPTKLGEQLSIPFRLSFNTLLKNKIIKEENGR